METAGRAVAQVLVSGFRDVGSGSVLIAAGAGNNGGDGWVIARALHAVGIRVWVVAVDPKTDDAIDNRALARLDGVRELGREEAWPQATVAVDALLGTGAIGPAKGEVLALARRLGWSHRRCTPCSPCRPGGRSRRRQARGHARNHRRRPGQFAGRTDR